MPKNNSNYGSLTRDRTVLMNMTLQAGQEAGYLYTDDMNGYQQEGVGYMDATIHQGKR